MKQGNRWWKSKTSAVAEWLYLTFLVSNHPILHSSIRNMVSGDSFPYIFLKLTFPSSIFGQCFLSRAFSSLFKFSVQRVERTLLMAGHWYANQNDNRHKNPPLWFLPWGCLMFKVFLLQRPRTLPMESYHWSYQWSKKYIKYWKKGNI